MYSTTSKEAIQYTGVIAGTLLNHFVPVVALFDSNSMHTFIAKTFIYRIGLCVEGR